MVSTCRAFYLTGFIQPFGKLLRVLRLNCEIRIGVDYNNFIYGTLNVIYVTSSTSNDVIMKIWSIRKYSLHPL